MRFLTILTIVLALCSLVMVTAAEVVFTASSGYQNVDQADAFVFPDGDQMVLALKQGGFVISGTRVETGCYHLTPPKTGEKWGRAEKVFFYCPKQ